jgi:hypothetical protein
VDEVWLWGGPWFGYWEYHPVTYCGKTIFVMGFNYERGIGEALHDFGHRMEYVVNKRVGDNNWQQNENNEWNKFSLINGHCGNIHYPPGTIVGSEEYKYNKTALISSDCDGYLTYPGGPFIRQSFNCQSWGCSQEGYVKWWLTRIPVLPSINTANGKTIYNNWWKYYAYFDETATALTTPTSTSIPTRKITPTTSPILKKTSTPSKTPTPISEHREPTVSLATIWQGMQLPQKGYFRIVAEADDASGISQIKIFIDNKMKRFCMNTPTCVHNWNMGSIYRGQHMVTVTAVDKSPANNQSTFSVQVVK